MHTILALQINDCCRRWDLLY